MNTPIELILGNKNKQPRVCLRYEVTMKYRHFDSTVLIVNRPGKDMNMQKLMILLNTNEILFSFLLKIYRKRCGSIYMYF